MNSEQIGQPLIEASQSIALKHMEPWLNEKHPDVILQFRVGSGLKTYHPRIQI